MKKIININQDWLFVLDKDHKQVKVDLPHNWNGIDGQDGGNDYYRGRGTYTKTFARPEGEEVWLECKGVNSSAFVTLNGQTVGEHHGGYSTFRFDLTPYLKDKNELVITADNAVNDTVYPQRADFTFYGGIYRDVNLICVDKVHFDLSYHGANPVKVDAIPQGEDGRLTVTAYAEKGEIGITVYDADGKEVISTLNGEEVTIPHVHLWNGVQDPYLYSAVATLTVDGKKVDEVKTNFGFRSFSVDENGFILNGKRYPLHGVSRHQDRPNIGNALTKREHEEDMALIKEIGANTVRLAHYQHDDYFYELCDKAGMVVWAEIPYISKHMTGGNSNTESQMTELILQQYNHASICFWGVSNEITMMKTDKKDMLENHHRLNDLCHRLDPHRLTTLACFAMALPRNKTAHITDVVSWNLYLGWYAPGLFLNDIWMWLFRTLYPHRPIGYSEYGAEGMTNLHAEHPKRFDNTEEYQCIYHEYLLRFFERHSFMWATHVWNMFDFAADGRNQGGDPGKNHKGLVTFDRKIKKDAFYLYKAYWSAEPVVHICGKRFIKRTGKKTSVTVYSNQGAVEVYNNGVLVAKSDGEKVFKFKLTMAEENNLVVKANGIEDTAYILKVAKADPAYSANSGNSMSWEK